MIRIVVMACLVFILCAVTASIFCELQDSTIYILICASLCCALIATVLLLKDLGALAPSGKYIHNP